MMVLTKKITPLFILGIPRSGTTLMLSLLDGHSQLLPDVGDSRFFNWYVHAKNKPFVEQVRLAEQHLLHMWNPDGVYYQRLLSHIPAEEIFDHFRRLVSESDRLPKDFLEAYVYAIGLAEGSLNDGVCYWIEKNPSNEYYLPKLTQWWPQARFIHVVRDPRDVYASYKMRDLKNDRVVTTADSTAFAWGKSVEMGLKYKERLGNDQYLFVLYEEMASNLEAVLQRVIAFLDIQDQPILRNPTKGHGQIAWGGNAATGNKQYEVHRARTQKWKTTLDKKDIRKLEALLKPEMDMLGYEMMYDAADLRIGAVQNIKQTLRRIRFHIRYR